MTLAARTVRGPIRFAASGAPARRQHEIVLPEGTEGGALFPEDPEASLPRAEAGAPAGLARYALPSGRPAEFEAKPR